MPHKDRQKAAETRKAYRKRPDVIEKRKLYERERYKRLPYDKERHQKNRLKYLYGLTVNEYQLLLDTQNGKCKICKVVPKKLFVDHDHSTGKVRGLLCNNCNLALGLLKEDSEVLANMIKYIAEFKGF